MGKRLTGTTVAQGVIQPSGGQSGDGIHCLVRRPFGVAGASSFNGQRSRCPCSRLYVRAEDRLDGPFPGGISHRCQFTTSSSMTTESSYREEGSCLSKPTPYILIFAAVSFSYTLVPTSHLLTRRRPKPSSRE